MMYSLQVVTIKYDMHTRICYGHRRCHLLVATQILVAFGVNIYMKKKKKKQFEPHFASAIELECCAQLYTVVCINGKVQRNENHSLMHLDVQHGSQTYHTHDTYTMQAHYNTHTRSTIERNFIFMVIVVQFNFRARASAVVVRNIRK